MLNAKDKIAILMMVIGIISILMIYFTSNNIAILAIVVITLVLIYRLSKLLNNSQ